MAKEFKTEDDFIEFVETMNLQNTNGRETMDDMFRLGVKACLDECKERGFSIKYKSLDGDLKYHFPFNKIIDFVGDKSQFDGNGAGYIWGVKDNGKHEVMQMIAEVRGYGAIQNLFREDDGGVDFKKADNFQDDVGRFIADAISEKIQREKVKLDKS